MKIQDLAINHDYYCSNSNYYSNEAHTKYPNWNDFYSEMGDADIDMTLCFRWDVTKNDNGTFSMQIFIMHQRKGIFWPNEIEMVTDEDVESILSYLKLHKAKIDHLWNLNFKGEL